MHKLQRGFALSTLLLSIVVLAGIGLAGWYVLRNKQSNKEQSIPADTQPPDTNTQESEGDYTFATPKKGAHFETSTPSHGSTLAAVPADVVIDFNFDLASNSTIRINKDGKDYGTGTTSVDTNKLAMRRQMDKTAPDGVYTVNYNGCWPDKTCHEGHFQFAINRSLLSQYQDMLNQETLTIRMSEIKFKPMNIRISAGTTVTWLNDDSVDHYVNTDSHPAHSHVPGLNSRALARGKSYSFTFTSTGAYPYHCSAHAADMTGNIVVE